MKGLKKKIGQVRINSSCALSDPVKRILLEVL